MDGFGVMHILDTLDAGGAETVAVNHVNALSRWGFRSHLCTTRREGPLAARIASDVGRLRLGRSHRLDPGAIIRIRRYVARHDVRILHAHNTSVVIGALASLLPPFPRLVWHVHHGGYASGEAPTLSIRLAARRAQAVVTVNEALATWARGVLPGRIGARVSYLPNFVMPEELEGAEDTDPAPLPGVGGQRVVCIANLRPEKDPITLVRAFALVASEEPEAHLLVVGDRGEPEGYGGRVREEIASRDLGERVTLMGPRDDVFRILRRSDVGVLSSASEGLPMALLEYAAAGLPVVVTRAGRCPDVVAGGKAGIVVPPGNPDALGRGIIDLLRAPERGRALGRRLNERVRREYGAETAMTGVTRIYHGILNRWVDSGQRSRTDNRVSGS